MHPYNFIDSLLQNGYPDCLRLVIGITNTDTAVTNNTVHALLELGQEHLWDILKSQILES